jgi:deazaflavin-dependent oxidoreductase (nitroreductase family)
MPDVKRQLTLVGNRVAVWLYGVLGGRVSSGRKGVHVLVITTSGRRTGVQRSTCVRYLDAPGGFLLWGTGLLPGDPDWFWNLREAKVANVRVGAKRQQVLPREVVGEERDEMWNNVVLAQEPEVAKYARRANRTIPVAILKPLEGESA